MEPFFLLQQTALFVLPQSLTQDGLGGSYLFHTLMILIAAKFDGNREDLSCAVFLYSPPSHPLYTLIVEMDEMSRDYHGAKYTRSHRIDIGNVMAY